MRFLIVSGMSGAGKSRALDALEDLGFYCVDNMPISLIPKFAEISMEAKGKYENVAIVTDVRSGHDFEELFDSLDNVMPDGREYQVLFLDASTEVLVNRYKETRRKHPLDTDGAGVKEAVARERELLEPIRSRADFIVDTTALSTVKLNEHLLNLFGEGSAESRMIISIISFGFKYGIPTESDLLFDVRFMPNPHYDPALRPFTGIDKAVRDYVFSTDVADKFMDHVGSLLDFLIPNYLKEGKTSLVISIGCTGGRHRSVAIAEEMRSMLKNKGYPIIVTHRDYKR